MLKKYWYAVFVSAVTCVFVIVMQYFFNPIPTRQSVSLKAKVASLNAQLADQRNTITAYQRALIGEERDVLSMYDSVQEARQIDIVVHSDTESGLPAKFQLICEGKTK